MEDNEDLQHGETIATGGTNQKNMSFITKLFTSIFGSKEQRQARRDERKKSGTKTAMGQFIQDFLRGIVGTGQTSFKEELEKYLPEVQTKVRADWTVFAIIGLGFAAIMALIFTNNKQKNSYRR